MKKFYKVASIADETPYSILLDGKPIHTPSGKELATPAKALAEAIMQEWAVQEDYVDPDSMPLTQFMTTCIDRVAAHRSDMELQVLNYLDTDLLCYRTDQPEDLAKAQAQALDPWIDWFEGFCGARLKTTTGLMVMSQPPQAHNKLMEAVQAMDEETFTILQIVVAMAGSVVLALAFVRGEISPESLMESMFVEERYKAEIYEEDIYGSAPDQELWQESIKKELLAASKFLALLDK